MYISCTGILRDGIFCRKINIELDLSRGLFSFLIVGLADKCIGESKERIISAIKNSGFDSPKTKNHKITVSLAPAGIKKEGVFLDLPIAVAYLTATEKIQIEKLKNSIFIGELGLDGSIKTSNFLASIIKKINEDDDANEYKDGDEDVGEHVSNITVFGNFKKEDIALIKDSLRDTIQIISVKNLKELVFATKGNNFKDFLYTNNKLGCIIEGDASKKEKENFKNQRGDYDIDKIVGQEKAKRALLIALCGNYNLIFAGPPGIGKTMLAKSAHQLLPSPNKKDILDLLIINNEGERPFRSPHHTSSYSAIIGGGNPITSGEITLAHKGILFLDELPEFNKNILESLRLPLEEKSVQINRTGDSIRFPCETLCIGAMNLCPCGNRGIPNQNCVCGPSARNKYSQKLSKPLLERFPIIINLRYETIQNKDDLEIHGVKMSGVEINRIVNIFYEITGNNHREFIWEKGVLDLLDKKAVSNNYSIRIKNKLRQMTETIALIEKIKSFQIKGGKDKEMNEHIRIIIKEEFVLESFSYREELR